MKHINNFSLLCLILLSPIITTFAQTCRDTLPTSRDASYTQPSRNTPRRVPTSEVKEPETRSVYDYGHNFEMLDKDAPTFTFNAFNGEKISLDQFKGKIVLLDFWETWCGKCISTFPEINRIAKEYKSKGIEVLGITTENKNLVKKLIKKHKLEYINIFADRTMIKKYELSSRPIYILVSKEGKIIFVSYGNLKIVENKLKQLTGL